MRFLVGFLFLCSAPALVAQLVISEFLARNETGLRDADGHLADWIEIWNRSDEEITLDGWTLTDNPERLQKWAFPAATLTAGERRVVFATRKDRRDPDGEWHTNFRLSAPGETLVLVMPDGETIAHQLDAAPQFDDVSYGLGTVTDDPGYLNAVTPGEANGALVYAGPIITDVQHAPEILMPGDDVVVSARVVAREAAVAEVTLLSTVDHGAQGMATMRDDGEGVDAQAGDGIFTAAIAGSTLFGPRIKAGHLVRWAIHATDTASAESRLPTYLDRDGVEQSPEYFGTMAQVTLDTALPVFSWFTDKEAASRTRGGARASVFYEGRFYDNIFVRQRGGATNGQSQKFNFSNAFPCYVNDALPAVGELNLNAQGSDNTFLRQPLAFETFQWVGGASCDAFLTVMRLNGEEDRTGVLIEQVDEDFLERYGFDPLGDLYKLVQRANLQPVFADTITGIEKKTGDETDLSSMATLVEGLDLEGDALTAYLFDSINLPQVVNYLAVRSIIQDADDVRKNFYVYYDTFGTQEWAIFPWDKDWTFGVTGDGGQHLKHPFFGDEAHRKDNANQWNKLYDAMFNQAATKQMVLRRLRTVMDTILQPEDTPEADRRFETRVDELFAQAEGDVPASAASTVKRFFPERRRDLYQTYASLIPNAQDAAPPMSFGTIRFQPESGDQDDEFIELLNPNRVAIDLSGWTLEGAVTFTFAEGTVVPSSSLFNPGLNRLYVSPNVRNFRSRAISPTGGEGLFVQGPYDGHLSNRGETLILKNREGVVIAEQAFEGDPTPLEQWLRLTEIHYRPTPREAEFLELHNASPSETLDLSGARFTDGIDFDFADGTTLAAGETLLLVRDPAVFAEVFGDAVVVFGTFANDTRLNDGGERLKLEDAANRTIFEVRYDNEAPWPTDLADTQGLTLIEPAFEEAASWQAATPSPGVVGGEAPHHDFTDADGDGWVLLLEDAFATSDADPTAGPDAWRITREGTAIVVTAPAVAGFQKTLQSTRDLNAWEDTTASSFTLSDVVIDGIPHFRWESVGDLSEVSLRALRIRVQRE